jgi:hypothetical protein
MRLLVLVAVVVALGGSVAGTAAAQQPVVAWPAKKVTMRYKDTPVRQIVADLFKGTGQQYVVTPDISNVRISVNLQNAAFPVAMHTVLGLAKGIYRPEPPKDGSGNCCAGRGEIAARRAAGSPCDPVGRRTWDGLQGFARRPSSVLGRGIAAAAEVRRRLRSASRPRSVLRRLG